MFAVTPLKSAVVIRGEEFSFLVKFIWQLTHDWANTAMCQLTMVRRCKAFVRNRLGGWIFFFFLEECLFSVLYFFPGRDS